MHLAGAIERCLTHSQMHVEQKQIAKLQNNQLFQIITQANDILRETLNLSLTAAETYYIYQLIDTEIQK